VAVASTRESVCVCMCAISVSPSDRHQLSCVCLHPVRDPSEASSRRKPHDTLSKHTKLS